MQLFWPSFGYPTGKHVAPAAAAEVHLAISSASLAHAVAVYLAYVYVLGLNAIIPRHQVYLAKF